MKKKAKNESRESPVGLGFRVPLVVASPWNRGGNVCSEVFDHTSIIQFLEKFVGHKLGKPIRETNISEWRRTICGDLTSTFKPYNGEKVSLPKFVERDEFVEGIHKSKFKALPNGYKSLTPSEVLNINQNPGGSPFMPQQEKGTRPACPLPYQLYVDARLSSDKKSIELFLKADDEIFGKKSDGAPFAVYAPGKYLDQQVKVWNYAVKSGDTLKDSYKIDNFENRNYHLRTYGPNGFFREYSGNANDPSVEIICEYQLDKTKKPTGNIELQIKNLDTKQKNTVQIIDNAYKMVSQTKVLDIAGHKSSSLILILNLEKSFSWYDFSVKISGNKLFEKRFAGHVETGKESQSDPYMGRMS